MRRPNATGFSRPTPIKNARPVEPYLDLKDLAHGPHLLRDEQVAGSTDARGAYFLNLYSSGTVVVGCPVDDDYNRMRHVYNTRDVIVTDVADFRLGSGDDWSLE